MEHLHAYVHDEIAARLRRNAREEERSLAGELRRALRLYVEGLDGRRIKAAAGAADEGLGGAATSSSAGPATP